MAFYSQGPLCHTSLIVEQLQFDQDIGSQLDEAQFGRVTTPQKHPVLKIPHQHPIQRLTKVLHTFQSHDIHMMLTQTRMLTAYIHTYSCFILLVIHLLHFEAVSLHTTNITITNIVTT